jgi:hypothetical protein
MRIAREETPVGRTRSGESVPDPTRPRGAGDEAARRAPEEDAIEISMEARTLQAEEPGARPAPGAARTEAATTDLPLDAERLKVIRDRIESGHYETRQVTEMVAQRLLELLGLAPLQRRD